MEVSFYLNPLLLDFYHIQIWLELLLLYYFKWCCDLNSFMIVNKSLYMVTY